MPDSRAAREGAPAAAGPPPDGQRAVPGAGISPAAAGNGQGPAPDRPAGSARPWTGLSRWWSLAAAVAAGLALAGAFPPVGFWPLAAAGPALLTLAICGKRRVATFALSLACGLVFFLGLLSWLVNVAWYAWFTLAVIEALIFAVLGLALRPLLRLRAWPLAVAGWWVLQEAVHDRFPWGGFPWGRLAMSQAAAPTAGWVAIGGPPLLTFLVALAGACAAYLIVARLSARAAGRPASRAVRLPAVLAVAAAGLALAGNLVWTGPPGPARTAVIATVQGDVPHARDLPKLLRASKVTANHAAATIALAHAIKDGRRPEPALVIWPENSTDIDPVLSSSTYASIAGAVDAVGRPVLVGAVLNYPLRNAGQLWLPHHGPVAVYIKRQLVPFGEVIPLRGLLSLVTSLPSLQPRNFRPGHKAVVFHVGPIRLGDLICYEVGFDNLVRSEVRAGANLIAVQTNDADFELDGQMGETGQQLAMARIDAIEAGRTVAVASTTGVSALIGPDGSVLARTGTWQRAVLDARVPLRTGLTPAYRAGAWPEIAIIALTIAGLAWSLTRSLRRRRAS
ncbi:MAG TPA: apolipoprotein N-acyltransferase [Streptosporangiaceae bacterium]